MIKKIKLKVGELYEIEGEFYKLMKSEYYMSSKNKETKTKKFYFKKPSFEDAIKLK